MKHRRVFHEKNGFFFDSNFPRARTLVGRLKAISAKNFQARAWPLGLEARGGQNLSLPTRLYP